MEEILFYGHTPNCNIIQKYLEKQMARRSSFFDFTKILFSKSSVRRPQISLNFTCFHNPQATNISLLIPKLLMLITYDYLPKYIKLVCAFLVRNNLYFINQFENNSLCVLNNNWCLIDQSLKKCV